MNRRLRDLGMPLGDVASVLKVSGIHARSATIIAHLHRMSTNFKRPSRRLSRFVTCSKSHLPQSVWSSAKPMSLNRSPSAKRAHPEAWALGAAPRSRNCGRRWVPGHRVPRPTCAVTALKERSVPANTSTTNLGYVVAFIPFQGSVHVATPGRSDAIACFRTRFHRASRIVRRP